MMERFLVLTTCALLGGMCLACPTGQGNWIVVELPVSLEPQASSCNSLRVRLTVSIMEDIRGYPLVSLRE